jgi:alanine racemase
MQHSYTRVEIDLRKYRGNLDLIRSELGGTRLLLVLKANAYGLGAVGMLPAISDLPDIFVGVAMVDEALELRQADYRGNILVMGYTPPEQYKLALRHFLSLGVYHPENIAKLEDAAAERGTVAKVHIKVDTGMHRVGVMPADLPKLLDEIKENPHVAVEGVFSHLAGAGDPADPLIPQQVTAFRECASRIEDELGVHTIKHIANTSGALAFPESRFDMVRIGILPIGFHPPGFAVQKLPVQPILRFSTEVVDARRVPAGTGVSYGHKFHTETDSTIITVPLGYADGIPYHFFPEGRVLFRGKRRRIAGAVNMDYLMISADDETDVQIGEEVVLVGRQGDEEISLNEFADYCESVNYDIICKMGRRIRRDYLW